MGSTKSRMPGFACLVAWTLAVFMAEITLANPKADAPSTLAGDNFLTAPGDQWKLIWHDEFAETSLDLTKWTSGLSWAGDDGAHQHHNAMYASLIEDDDVQFQNGMLALLTKKTDVVDHRGRTFHYTQAFIQTQGKFDYKYGYCEIRARFPKTQAPVCGLLSGCSPPAGRPRTTSPSSGPAAPCRISTRDLPIASR